MMSKNKKSRSNPPLPMENRPTPAVTNPLMQAFHRGDYAVVESLALTMTRDFPHHVFGWKALGVALGQQEKNAEAAGAMQRAAQLSPDDAEIRFNLGTILKRLGRMEEAEAALGQAIRLQPNHVLARNNLGNLFRQMGRLHEAEALFRQTIGLKPDYAEAHNNLGNVLRDFGRLDEALVCYRRAMKVNPDYTDAQSNLLFVTNYCAAGTSIANRNEAIAFGMLVKKQRVRRYKEWQCSSSPAKLRIGFVSGDFRSHPVGFFLEGLLANIDPERAELFAYTTQGNEDELTGRIKPFFAAWREIFTAKDEAAAALIHGDALHLLIDLSGHTAKNRLPVFAYKPAPIQASWLGYFATTGVEEIDYFLGDPVVLPKDEEEHFTESLWRLPETYLCFSPPREVLEIQPLPALTNGFITFGCFNNLTKMNDAVIALWANVLGAVTDSRLFLKTRQLDDMIVVKQVLGDFARHGIAADRLILEGHSPRAELLASYNRVDMGLDPFPYPGGTTTAEALWMGVPVLTRLGDRFLSHIGESIAHNANQSEWIATDDDDYVKKAVQFSSDFANLASLRKGLRAQVLASPLFDAPRFAHHFEAALWGMWNHWVLNRYELEE